MTRCSAPVPLYRTFTSATAVLIFTCCFLHSSSAVSLYDEDGGVPLLQRFWPNGPSYYAFRFFHTLDRREESVVTALPHHLASYPHPPFVLDVEESWSHTPHLYPIHPYELLSISTESRAVPCYKSFYLVLPALVKHTLPGECSTWPPNNCTGDTDESQPPVWWLSHPIDDLRHSAPSIRLLRSFVVGPTRKSGTPALPASYDNAIVWEMESDVAGAVNLLHLSSFNHSITINLTTDTSDCSDRYLAHPGIFPRYAAEHSSMNVVRFSPFSYTFALEPRTRALDRWHQSCNFTAPQVSFVCLNLSSSSTHFRWELPIHTPIALYLPQDPRISWGNSNQPRWHIIHCGNRTLSSQAPSVHLLHQHQVNSYCPVGEEGRQRAADPLAFYEVWHLLGMSEGMNRLELQYRLPGVSSSCGRTAESEQSWFEKERRCWADGKRIDADVTIEMTFVDAHKRTKAIAQRVTSPSTLFSFAKLLEGFG